MFDDQLKRYRQYFTVLQILRISSDWIKTSMENFKSEVETTWYTHIYEIEHDVILRSNGQALVSYKEEVGKRLLSRIEKKTEEVKSLSEGVSSCSEMEPTPNRLLNTLT